MIYPVLMCHCLLIHYQLKPEYSREISGLNKNQVCTGVCVTNNNNNHDNVYGAVIVAKATARVHPVHMEWCQAAANPQTWPNDPDCKSICRLPEATSTIAIYYYYSARKLILISPSHKG